MRLVFFDLETTGLGPVKHEVMQVAAVSVDDALRVVDEFEVKVRVSWKEVPKDVKHLTRYDREVWRREAVSPRVAALRFAKFLKTHATRTVEGERGPRRVAQLAAHNANFDGPFLRAWSRRMKVEMPSAPRVLCTLQRAEWFFVERGVPRPGSLRLLELCKVLGIPFDERVAHEALADVRATVELYRRLVAAGALPWGAADAA